MAEFKITATCSYCNEILDHDFVPGIELNQNGKLPEVSLFVGLDHRCTAMIEQGILSARNDKPDVMLKRRQ